MLKHIKREIRILGIDDSPFDRETKEVLVVGTVFRGSEYIDGLISCYVDRDGNDATGKLIELIKKTKHLGQLKCIMLDGIALAGFNVINIKKLNEETNLPVIVTTRKMPNFEKIAKALKKINQEDKIDLMKIAGKIYEINVNGRSIYSQFFGIGLDSVKKIIKLTSIHSNIPEPIRVSHLIASGIVLGESHGRA